MENHLVFFDTFSHESSTSQLDLVQFQLPVQVSQIRVIPLGARVQADFPGGIRLGATNPSQFEIEFFVNDLSKRGAATFESIGCLQYSQHGEIKMDFGTKLPTDGLLLRGKYNTITLAVYGRLAKVCQDVPAKSQSDTPQPPPEKVNTHERIRDWLADTKVPRSPEMPWDELGQTKIDNEKRKDKRKSIPREIDKLRASHERSSHSRERSWDLSEKDSFRKSKNESVNKNSERELFKDRDMIIKIKDNDSADKDRTRDSTDKEWDRESDLGRGRDIDYDKERNSSHEPYEEELIFSKKRKIIDEWEHRSETSSHSMRRPRTPQDVEKVLSDPRISRSPYLCVDEAPRKEWEEKDWDRESKEKDWDRGKSSDSFRNWSRSRSRDKDRGRSPPKSPEQVPLLPPILSDEMEAISDDEELLNLPIDGDYPPEENIEGSINDENEAFEYEDIMSDEEELSGYQYEDEYVVEEWEDYLKPLSTQELLDEHHLQYFHPPSFTEYEARQYSWDMRGDKEKVTCEGYGLAAKLISLTNNTTFPTDLCEEIKDPDDGVEMGVIEIGETWVQALEYTSQLLPVALVYVEDKKEILRILYSWVEVGLNFDKAMNQQQPLYKIRHIKAGVKLALSLLQCNASIVVDLLNQGILDKLIDLLGKQYMAVSIKLLIMRAIDAIVIKLEGIRFIINKSYGKSGYEKILELFSSFQQYRVKVSISSIVRKVHFLEVCSKFHDDVTNLGNVLQIKYGHVEDQDVTDTQVMDKLDGQSLVLQTSIESCLREIVRCFLFADQLMTQSVRWLPGSKFFQFPKSDYDAYPQMYKIFDETKTMEAISVLLAASQLINNAAVLKLINIFLEYMLGVEHGILYVAWRGKASSAIIKSLLQFEKDERDSRCESMFQHLGWRMAYSIHIAKQFDDLGQISDSQGINNPKQEFKLSDTAYDQACSSLNALQSILLSAVGKEVLVHTLTLPKFARIIFRYLRVDPESELEEQSAAAACFGYAVDILVTCVKLNPSGIFLELCSAQLTEIIGRKEANVKVDDYAKLATLLPYLSIAKAENFSHDNLPVLITTVQDSIEKLDKFPGELFSSLQMLCHLTIPGRSFSDIGAEHCTDELVEELRFNYATVQLFSGDLHTHLINLLSKLCSMYGQVFLQGSNFTTAEGKMVLLLISPAVTLLKNLLASVIEVRNTDFKDLTAIAPLLNSYLLLDVFPSSPYYPEAKKTQGVIISIILLFTQPVYTTEGEEVLAKSLWTLMMTEVFKVLQSSPRNVVCMLKLVVKLLPLPLPIQSHSPLTEEEISQAVRLRKLWSAHLYILSGALHDIIVRLGVGSHPALTHALRKMCVAVADLSAPMALLVARSTLDLVMQSHRLDQKSVIKEGQQLMSAQTCRVLGMLGSLMSHAPIKTAIVHLLRGGGASLTAAKIKTEEKYPNLVNIWCNALTTVSNVQIHIASQSALLVAIYNLFNQDTAMRLGFNPKKVYLSGVSPKDLLVPLVEAIVDSLRTCLSVNSANIAISVLLLLLNHNYGFYYVKCAIDKKKGCLHPILNMLCSVMPTNFEESFHLLQNIITFCEDLLHPNQHRTYVATPSDVQSLLGWKVKLEDIQAPTVMPMDVDTAIGEDCGKTVESRIEIDMNLLEQTLIKMEDVHLKNAHPLLLLDKLLVENGQEDEVCEILSADIKYLIVCMESDSLNLEIPNLECIEHTIDSLQSQFASRITWLTPIGDEDQSTWFLPVVADSIDESDMVKVNLLDICMKYTDNYDLAGALQKTAKGLACQTLSPQKISKTIPNYKTSSSAIRPDRIGKPYVAPMRGRNFGRGNIRSDPFRSRPPNTSRPPSLHVDDFVALESTGHQPTGPTGYNKISFGRGKMMLDSMRGRGRQRGMNDSRGNRFYHRTPFRAMRSRPQGWGYRGDGSRGSYRVSAGGSGHFMRGRAPPGTYRGRGMSGNNKERFSMKYMDRGRRKYT